MDCAVRWLGQVGYAEAWDLQKALVAQRFADEIPDTLLLLEHPSTITLGRATQPEHLLTDRETLAKIGFTVLETDRGGDVTYHGPGQLVGYPILNLKEPPHQPDLHRYLRLLEESLICTLACYGIPAGRFPGYTGVWTQLETAQPEKIAAIGIKTSRWITSHGFALNVCPDLSHFSHIVPCGIHDYGVTSLETLLSRNVPLEEVLPHVIEAFGSTFALEIKRLF